MKETSIKWNDGRCENEEGDREAREKNPPGNISKRDYLYACRNFARLRRHITRSCLLEVQSLCEIFLLEINAMMAKRLILVNLLVAAIKRWKETDSTREGAEISYVSHFHAISDVLECLMRRGWRVKEVEKRV
jgi:hypothetical protein